MTDLEIAEFVMNIARRTNLDGYAIEIFKEGGIGLIEKERATQYRSKQDKSIFVEIPRLSRHEGIATAQLALAVGRRIERFERGAKANSIRTPDSRKKIAQNAIQTRWSAKL